MPFTYSRLKKLARLMEQIEELSFNWKLSWNSSNKYWIMRDMEADKNIKTGSLKELGYFLDGLKMGCNL